MEPNFALTGSVHETLLLMYVDVKLFLSLPRKSLSRKSAGGQRGTPSFLAQSVC
ncbi:hypothetical protein Trisim1_011907 [Trichoderma cf. simile WF8]